MSFSIHGKVLRTGLLIGWLIVISLGIASEISFYRLPPNALSEMKEFLSLSYEENLPTWYSSLIQATCAVMLCILGARSRAWKSRFQKHWFVLALVFFYISLDEAVSIHEAWGGWTDAGGVLYFDWVIPGSILVLILCASYFQFLRALPRRTAAGFVLAGAITVGGAMGIELWLSWWTESHGSSNLGYALIDFIEESMEILGLSMFIAVLFEELTGGSNRLTLTASSNDPIPTPTLVGESLAEAS